MDYRRLRPHHTPRFLPLLRLGDARAITLRLPGYRQTRSYSCGFACALMVLRYFDLEVKGRELFGRLGTGRDGTRQNAIVRELRALGLRANVRYDVGLEGIRHAVDRGKLVIGYLAEAEHWVVVYGYGLEPERIYVADPRPETSCEHLWDRFGPRLKRFGIVCSRASLAPARSEPTPHPGPVASSEPVQLAFDFGRA